MYKSILSFLAVAIICLPLQLMAQKISAQLDLGRRDPHPDFIEYSPVDKGLVTLGPSSTSSSRFISVTKYDSDFEEEWSKKAFEQNGRRNLDFLAIIGENILVFVSEFFPKEQVIKTFYYQYNLEGTLLSDEQILSVYPNQKEQKVELNYMLSPNKGTLLCYKNLENKRESEQLLYFLFDETGSYTSNGEIKLKYPDDMFKIRSVQISNQGNIYLLGKFYKVTRIRDAEDFKFLVYRFNTQTLQGEEIPIELGDRYITNLSFRLDKFENIYVAGFYSNQGTDKIIGTVFQKITPEGGIEVNTVQEFGDEFLSQYMSSGQIGRGKELRNFYLNNIILRSDGGVLLLAEKFYITYQNYRDIYGYYVEREIYNYEDVILTSVDPEGKIEWHAIVDKSQRSETPQNLSYFGAIGSKGVFIFYEYNPRRMDRNIYYNTIGVDGTVTNRLPLLKAFKFGNEFYPRFCEQINNGEALMVYFQNRGKTLTVTRVNIDG